MSGIDPWALFRRQCELEHAETLAAFYGLAFHPPEEPPETTDDTSSWADALATYQRDSLPPYDPSTGDD